MRENEQILYDTGRMPYWFRLPGTIIGISILWLAASIAANSLFGITLGIDWGNASGSSFWGFIACCVIGLLWTGSWFYQVRIIFNTETRELIYWATGSRRKIPYDNCTAISISRAWRGGLGNRQVCNINLVRTDGKRESVYDMDSESDAEALAQALARGTGLNIQNEFKQPAQQTAAASPSVGK